VAPCSFLSSLSENTSAAPLDDKPNKKTLTHCHSPPKKQTTPPPKHPPKTLSRKQAPGRRARRGERQAVPVPRLRVPHHRPQKVHGPQRQGARAPAAQTHDQVDALPARERAGALPPPRRHAPRPQAAEPAGGRHARGAVPQGGRPGPGPRVQRAREVLHARDRDAVVPRARGLAGVGVLRVPRGHVVGGVHLCGAGAQGEQEAKRGL
jgi:hypothetical protein